MFGGLYGPIHAKPRDSKPSSSDSGNRSSHHTPPARGRDAAAVTTEGKSPATATEGKSPAGERRSPHAAARRPDTTRRPDAARLCPTPALLLQHTVLWRESMFQMSIAGDVKIR
ncbi:uncharacterized protein [Triticum aestivum]|uniref:uncharacterized protein n=1 Tax=Triticum aestivum TaxID=4565 RepID=UPI00098A1B20|nr:uncharacterized protein LOC123055710 [Triticum aestivum]